MTRCAVAVPGRLPLAVLTAVCQVKKAERQLEFLAIQEGYIKDEMKNLKREMIRAKEVGARSAVAAIPWL